jgi:hypothetical protein
MRVRFRRTPSQQRARTLLAVALLLPAAGFLQAAGINPVSVAGVIVCAVASFAAALSAIRPILIVLRVGITIPGSLGRPATSLGWREVKSVETTGGLVSLTTTSRVMYQLQLGTRGAEFLNRMVARNLLAGKA